MMPLDIFIAIYVFAAFGIGCTVGAFAALYIRDSEAKR